MKTRYTAKFLTDEGGSAGFYSLKESRTIGFKEFSSKSKANYAYKIQKKLARLGLAPKVYGKICKIAIEARDFCGDKWLESSGWGFLTQIVKIKKRLSRKKIQDLVDNIKQKAKLSFWDCHEYNIGVHRNKYVCVDTGRESFDSNCDSWGMGTPGPFCRECNKYTCKCDWKWNF
jgi:hypothetical protein